MTDTVRAGDTTAATAPSGCPAGGAAAARPPREHYLYGPELLADPYGEFGRIREEQPVARGRLWDGRPVWVVTRYDDVAAVLGDRRFVTNTRSVPGVDNDAQADFFADVLHIDRDLVRYVAGNLAHTDPPVHTRLRKLVSRAFSAARVMKLRPRVHQLTADLLDELPGHAEDGVVDILEHFAYPLPITVICELLGVPAEDHARWRAWSREYTSMDPRRLNRMLAEMDEHLRDLAARRRREPADDLITALVQVQDDDEERLSDPEFVAMVLTLMVGGHETTAHVIGNGILALLTRPGHLALLRDEPERIPAAVQELIRWGSPVIVPKLRYAAEDVTVADTVIRQGERVQVVLGSANHDPRRYADPDALDLDRPLGHGEPRHLAYGPGLHYCLGVSLANQEAEEAFAGLLARYPQVSLAADADSLEWQRIGGHRALVRLPVSLGPPS